MVGARVLVVVTLCGCEPAPVVLAQPYRASNFGLLEAMSEREHAQRPLRSLESISLGYVGDAPLAGGIMADTPPPEDEPAADPDDDVAPPLFIVRRGTVKIGSVKRRRFRR